MAVGLLIVTGDGILNTVKVGVACPIPGERAAFLEWLTHAGYEPGADAHARHHRRAI